VLVGAAALALSACSEDAPPATSTSSSARSAATTSATAPGSTAAPTGATSLTAADFDGLGTCTLLPEATAGPFPLDEQLVRRDITEGYDGHPLRVGLRVVDESCTPIAGAAVEIWHCDATGDYSAFTDGGGGKDEGTGTTFCRGTQVANDDGIVEFHTIYPGWYTGRAVHIHLRVHADDELVLTSQIYFDDAYTSEVYTEAPYAAFGDADTPTSRDGIAGDPASDGSLLALRPEDGGTLALLNLGVAV
jgi:protocatechuate 3,4-dioxygenase beta subunit